MTAAQKWDVSVFVLSTERPCDWGDLAGVGVTAAPYPVACMQPNAYKLNSQNPVRNGIE